MVIYGLKNCDTCRKARKALQAAGHSAELHDVRETPLTEAQIARFHQAFETRLVNKSSATWRGLDEDQRVAAPQALLKAHPTLMKRPVIDAGGTLYLGWTKDVQAALLK